ncbi:hypothetical protein L228DRAFT_245983 [Xylona heveae TC161]|uniref:ATP-dependent RNA helicase SUV3, mitochondrial n=1 Tax=Xylona heveae (strain CBS 132557 / TC161) TaxID=1328760 RepID=A0A165HB57_XYLHT|nr:hypothetical protein L228DRAFT_245983 [Xylona heveae TC161]KZF23243.1 hypothetical protein L228DRAFT_245983 [Xylona heveae TC161]
MSRVLAMRGVGGQNQCIFCAFRIQQPWMPTHSRRVNDVIRRTRYISTSLPIAGSSASSFGGRRTPKDRPARFGGAAKRSGMLRIGGSKFRQDVKFTDIKDTIRERMDLLEENLGTTPQLEPLGLSEAVLKRHFEAFKRNVLRSFSQSNDETSGTMPLFHSLRAAFVDKDVRGLDSELKYTFYGHVASARFSKKDIEHQKMLADLRFPVEWYPGTRVIQRTIHLHVGPTNSGKTYHALKRLEQANTGVYAGPLRLLAHEVYSRLLALGKRCNLITGDDRKMTETSENAMNCCTVEMVPVNTKIDVAVIDEIQMIGSQSRGWAWTQAFLGVKAKEVHLCGEERVVPLIRALAASMGEELVIHRYQRLSPLKTMSTSLKGDLRQLRKGDCVVVFSRMGIHATKREIERATGKRVAIVYGSLPPEVRAQQAKLFNDESNDYDILVASDAIGMGLNLNIKRIIFESSQKHNGKEFRTLEVSDIKQIAGRAGRYRTASQATEEKSSPEAADVQTSDVSPDNVVAPLPPAKNLGLVTTLEQMDLKVVQEAMESEPEPIQSAGLFPPSAILEQFASYFPPETPFSYILLRLHELSRLHPRYHLCALRDQIEIADMIQPIKNLSIEDKVILCAAPVSARDPGVSQLVAAFAQCIANQGGGALLDIPEVNLELLDKPASSNMEYLRQLETLHKGLILYLWLSYRFAGVFTSRPLAFHVKEMVEERIDKSLHDYRFDPKVRKLLKRAREQSMIEKLTKGTISTEASDSGNDFPLKWDEGISALRLEEGATAARNQHVAS